MKTDVPSRIFGRGVTDGGGAGRVIAGCREYQKRFEDRAAAERWCRMIEDLGTCPMAHGIILDTSRRNVRQNA